MPSTFSTGRIIGQTITSYAWTGTAGASSSTKSVSGVVQRTNLNPAPRFGAGWSTNRASVTVDDGMVLTVNAVGYFPRNISPNIPVTAGQTITLSTTVRAAGAHIIGVQWLTAAGNAINSPTVDAGTAAMTTAPGRLALTVTVPANIVTASIWLGVPDNSAVGAVASFSRLLVESGMTTGEYFDGDTPNTIVNTYETATPLVVTGYEATREVRNVFNPVLGAQAVVAAAFPAGLRSGTLTAVFTDRASASILDTALAGTTPLTFTDTEVPGVGMTFLADQRIRLYPADDDVVLDGTPTRFWFVEFGYQEVTL